MIRFMWQLPTFTCHMRWAHASGLRLSLALFTTFAGKKFSSINYYCVSDEVTTGICHGTVVLPLRRSDKYYSSWCGDPCSQSPLTPWCYQHKPLQITFFFRARMDATPFTMDVLGRCYLQAHARAPCNSGSELYKLSISPNPNASNIQHGWFCLLYVVYHATWIMGNTYIDPLDPNSRACLLPNNTLQLGTISLASLSSFI